MATLIHLNGPPAVGKSTLARLWAERHPGVLALDGDAIVALIGGWRENFWSALGSARRLAAAMAREHLGTGMDVVLPQLVTDPTEIAPYLDAAHSAGASYVEIVLTARPEQTTERRNGRADEVARTIDRIVARRGGAQLIAKIETDLRNYAQERRSPRLATDGSDVETTYAALERLLAQHRDPATP